MHSKRWAFDFSIGGTSEGFIAALVLAALDKKGNPKSERIAVALANQDLYEFREHRAITQAPWFGA